MRQLIEVQQKALITCDNPDCNYEVAPFNNSDKYLVYFVDMPCPKCGQNLLTKEDFLKHQQILKAVKFINRWFSWITLFYSKKKLSTGVTMETHFHDNQITVKKDENGLNRKK